MNLFQFYGNLQNTHHYYSHFMNEVKWVGKMLTLSPPTSYSLFLEGVSWIFGVSCVSNFFEYFGNIEGFLVRKVGILESLSWRIMLLNDRIVEKKPTAASRHLLLSCHVTAASSSSSRMVVATGPGVQFFKSWPCLLRWSWASYLTSEMVLLNGSKRNIPAFIRQGWKRTGE